MKPRWQHRQVSPNKRLTSDGSSTCRTSHSIGEVLLMLPTEMLMNGSWFVLKTISVKRRVYYKVSKLLRILIFSMILSFLPGWDASNAHEINCAFLIRIPKHQAPKINDKCWRPFLTLHLGPGISEAPVTWDPMVLREIIHTAGASAWFSLGVSSSPKPSRANTCWTLECFGVCFLVVILSPRNNVNLHGSCWNKTDPFWYPVAQIRRWSQLVSG